MATVGIVLAGGRGTRLGHLTKVTNKHLLPVGDEPMVYHPIRKLVGAGITNIMLVTGTEHMGDFVSLLGSGEDLGCDLTYRVQVKPGGIAQALGLCERFVDGRRCVVLLGDNIFYESLHTLNLGMPGRQKHVAKIVIKLVDNASRFGVAYIDGIRITQIIEKPASVAPGYATLGVYDFPPDVFDFIHDLKPSSRGELEITDVNNRYLEVSALEYSITTQYWTDAGTIESLHAANTLVWQTPPRYN
jgi:glucose-1-phosphate thymidylyltransferase